MTLVDAVGNRALDRGSDNARKKPAWAGLSRMERIGIEPMTSSLQSWRSPS